MKTEPVKRRQPIRGIGVKAARGVRSAIGYRHPTEIELEVVAYMRGALVRPTPARGARGNLLRVGQRGIISVAEGLSPEERRWAIAHELGHFEAHAGVSFVGLCTSADMLPAYEASGREPEANAFAAELLMPEDLVRPRCDVAQPSWSPIEALAAEFAVSLSAAALRFVELCDEAVCVVFAKAGTIAWSSASASFGPRPRRGTRVQPWTEAHEFFAKGDASRRAETVSASAWLAHADDDEELVEHLFPVPKLESAMSLLWRKVDERA